jgi:hypothetical protein
MAPFNIDLTSLKPSARSMRSTFTTTTSQLSSLPNAFNRLMEKANPGALRDTCSRLTLEYNTNYNLYAMPREDLPDGYNPYVFKEPLHDNRPVTATQLPKNYTITPLTKRARISWVWRLGYAIDNSSKPRKPVLMWHCKLYKYWGCCVFIINLK